MTEIHPEPRTTSREDAAYWQSTDCCMYAIRAIVWYYTTLCPWDPIQSFRDTKSAATYLRLRRGCAPLSVKNVRETALGDSRAHSHSSEGLLAVSVGHKGGVLRSAGAHLRVVISWEFVPFGPSARMRCVGVCCIYGREASAFVAQSLTARQAHQPLSGVNRRRKQDGDRWAKGAAAPHCCVFSVCCASYRGGTACLRGSNSDQRPKYILYWPTRSTHYNSVNTPISQGTSGVYRPLAFQPPVLNFMGDYPAKNDPVFSLRLQHRWSTNTAQAPLYGIPRGYPAVPYPRYPVPWYVW